MGYCGRHGSQRTASAVQGRDRLFAKGLLGALKHGDSGHVRLSLLPLQRMDFFLPLEKQLLVRGANPNVIAVLRHHRIRRGPVAFVLPSSASATFSFRTPSSWQRRWHLADAAKAGTGTGVERRVPRHVKHEGRLFVRSFVRPCSGVFK